MAKLDPLKVLLGPLAGGTIYDSPIAHVFGIKDPAEKRRLAAEAEAEAEKKKGAVTGMKRGGAVKKMAKGGKLTDLTGDGKVTRADVLKGRGVPGFSKGGVTRADGCAVRGKTKGKIY